MRAWLALSSRPPYASTSVIRSQTRPRRRCLPSSARATSATCPAQRSGGKSGESERRTRRTIARAGGGDAPDARGALASRAWWATLGDALRAPWAKPVDWDDLRYFLAVVREGTLTRAARGLGVNHTTVSRRMQALQEEVGVRLFDRLPGGWVPTAAGEDVRAVAERMETEVLGLDRRVLGRDERLSGTLRVTTIDMVAHRNLPHFREFVRRYPEVALELTVGFAPLSLSKREADVAIRATNEPPEHLVGRRLVRGEFALYAADALVEEVGADAPLDRYPWLGWDPSAGARLTDRWMASHVPDARVACRLDDLRVFESALAAGIGIGFLPCVDGDTLPGVRRLRPVEEGFGMDLWILTHPDLRQTARVRAFMQFFAEAIAADADLYEGRRPRVEPAEAPARRGKRARR